METQQLFAIFDSKVEAYLPPWTAPNAAVAMRTFETAVMREGSDFNNHSEDYSLWHIGNYDPQSGEVKTQALVPICNAHQIVVKHDNLTPTPLEQKIAV